MPTPRESYMARLNKATWSIAEAFEHLKEPDATTVSEAEMKLVKNILSGLELLTREG